MTHLDAIQLRLSNERVRLSNAKTDAERELRQVWANQTERELVAEYAFLGIEQPSITDISADNLLAELLA